MSGVETTSPVVRMLVCWDSAFEFEVLFECVYIPWFYVSSWRIANDSCESFWYVFWGLGTHQWKEGWEHHMFAKSIGVPRRVFPQTNLGCQERSRNLHQRHEGQGKSERRLEVGKIMVAGWQWISTLLNVGKLSQDCPLPGSNTSRCLHDGRTLKSAKMVHLEPGKHDSQVVFAIHKHIITSRFCCFISPSYPNVWWLGRPWLGRSIGQGLASNG